MQFADLHDTPARMTEKGVIRGVVPWEDARTVLYWRLRRRILESQLARELNLFRLAISAINIPHIFLLFKVNKSLFLTPVPKTP